MAKQIYMKEGLLTLCSLLLLLAVSCGLTVETNLITRSAGTGSSFAGGGVHELYDLSDETLMSVNKES